MSYDTYNVFYYVSKFKSITLAANYLNVSQPAVTKQIKKLEEKLEYTLFIRTKKGLILTTDGEKLFEEVSKAIEIFNMIENNNNLSKTVTDGVIRIISEYAIIKNILLPILLKFNRMYPNIKIYIECYPISEAIKKLRNGEVDLLVINNDYVEYSDIFFTPFYELHDILVVNSEIQYNYPKKIQLEKINNYPLICKKDSVFKELLNRMLDNIKLNPVWELSEYWLVEVYIKMNMGIGIISKEFISKELEEKKLIKIETDVELPKRELCYVIQKNNNLRPELSKLLSLFKKVDNKKNK